MTSYAEFLASKARRAERLGVQITDSDVHELLHPWQREIVRWAAGVGRAAVWADTGLGKTLMQLEWARLSGGRALIVAPLAVCQQTIREAAKIGVTVTYVRDSAEAAAASGMVITNYERIAGIDPAMFDAVVLDEASILKQSDGKTRNQLITHFASVPRRLACTATPAPNDPEELTNQAEFLGVSTRANMLAAYFVHDDEGWRVKGHARGPMFSWMSTWAVAIRRPSDMGYPDDGYQLPGLNITPHLLPIDVQPEGQLFATDLGGVGGRAAVRRATLAARCDYAVELIAREPGEQWLIWCGLNDEQDAIVAALSDRCRSIDGRTPVEQRVEIDDAWRRGAFPVMVVKPGMYSTGMNWQHCARMAFVGLNDSYEAYYQAIRRCYRYGQTRVVDAHIVLSELEGQIAANVRRKEREAARMTAELVAAIRDAQSTRRTA